MGSNGVKEPAVSWSFREGIFFSVALVALGFIIEATVWGGQGVLRPSWPWNVIILLLFIVNIVIAGLVLKDKPFIRWLGGIPLGLCLIIAMAVLSFFGGVLPQGAGTGPLWAQNLGLNSVFSSWPFILTVFFFLVNLGLSLVWKTVPFRSANLQFILFHGGFWIALACGLIGSEDFRRVIIPLYEGKATPSAFDPITKTTHDLPFTLYLHDFEMEEYEPRLMLYDVDDGVYELNKSRTSGEITEGAVVSWSSLSVTVDEFLLTAVIDEGSGVPVSTDSDRGIPYAFLSGTHEGKAFSGWVSTGSPFERPVELRVGNRVLSLWPGSPKKYRSRVAIKSDENGDVMTEVLEVNKPVSVDGWMLYQLDYDEKLGRWSELSIVEGIRDPWLPVVYVGFFMILAGNTLFFWKGIRNK